MDDATKAKARETRAKNVAARAARLAADAELKRAASQALKRVFEDQSASPDQVLWAAELLAKMSSH